MKVRVGTGSALILLQACLGWATCSPGASGSCEVGSGKTYATIQACATAMDAGQICRVFAGTYNETVTLSAGAAGAYKTVQVNGTDVVNVLGFTAASHTKIIGFHIQNPSSPGSHACVGIGSSTDVYVTDNVMTQCGGGSPSAMVEAPTSATASYIYVRGNTLSWACRTPSTGYTCDGVAVRGSHWLVENNDLSHYRLGLQFDSSYSIFRNNTFHDQYESEANPSANHTDAIFSEPDQGQSAQYNVIEGNSHTNAVGPNAKGFLFQGDACGGKCYNVIVRFNVAAHIDGTYTTNDIGAFHHVKEYNNTWVDTRIDGYSGYFTDYHAGNAVYAANLNSIYYYPAAVSNFNPYAADSSVVPTFTYGHALAYCTGGCSNLYGHAYSSGSFTADPGNQIADPKFVNYAGNDFHLTAASPAVGAGTYLTTVAAADSGSGTSLVVNDASYFQDGYQLSGAKPDQIRVGTSRVVQITSVNYATNTLVLANSITRGLGDPVYLYSDSNGDVVLSGNFPDLGAFPLEPVQTVAAPTGLTATVN